ncbi:MAG: DUF502 domain-containing protein [Sulfuricaulis sp.]|uniref:DUF502 domain-containing protein n=1 Tax=Sulfuricaulis sp. TaxID=2003553 RepID=UPI0025E5B164|nr:DUF502 domain-containing protein [Sulfuricaulis sp.]MCR4346892.1 DUF502 domain-containing protein [Sulfuricaulis sp.]
MKKITRTFLTGLAVTLPVVLTLYLLVWVTLTTERVLDRVLHLVLSEAVFVPGLGLMLGLVLVFLVGLLMRTWAARSIFAWTERMMYRVPVIKTVYGTLRDFTDFLSRPQKQGARQVVLVRLGGTDLRIMGFVTRDDLAGLPSGMSEPGVIMVYLPMSYQVGGYTVLVPRASVQPVDMSFEEAMRFTLTAGLSVPAVKDEK